jgi:glyoxylase-like metal-dependent hydrolase (beta-lactamase superfamily II)
MDSPAAHPEIERITAPNPGPMTLEGTNTYLLTPPDGGPAYVIDPGPADETHVAAVTAAAEAHGGIAGVLLTHSHADHSAAVPLLGAELLWGSVGQADESAPESGAGAEDAGWPDPPPRIGPVTVIPTPGHATDHVAFLHDGVCFTGDLVLGRGSSFVPPDGGSLAAYMDSLARLMREELDLLCPGHGPFVDDPAAKLREYVEHRLERERKLLAALAAGERSRARLLDRAWDDVPAELRPAAAMVMEAHLEKLAAEGAVEAVELRE